METALAILMVLGIFVVIPLAIAFAVVGIVILRHRWALGPRRAKAPGEAVAEAGPEQPAEALGEAFAEAQPEQPAEAPGEAFAEARKLF